MRYQNIEAIILKKTNVGESDQYVTLYSPEFGKIDAICKGSRKINSSFCGHLEVLNICKMQIYKGASRFLITQCQTVNSFIPLRNNLQLSIMAFLLIEIFYRTSSSAENGQELFELIKESLNELGKNKKNILCVESFKIKLLKLIGALPDISSCSECSYKWEEKDNIYLNCENHITCEKCAAPSSQNSIIPFSIMKLINFIAARPYKEIERIKLSKNEFSKLKKFSDTFLFSYMNCELNTEKIVNQMSI